MSNIPDPINFDFRRPRFLEQVTPSDTSNTPSEIRKQNQYIIDASYHSYEKTSDKANIILTQAEKVAEKYTIPVPVESTEVRQAVIRQEESGDGSVITFDLFKRMLSIVEDMATNVSYDIIDTAVLSDPNANSRIIRQKLDSRLDGEDEILALLMVGSEILTLYLIHQITGMWRGTEHILAAPKEGSGLGAVVIEQISPITEALQEAAIGLAVAQLVIGINGILANMFLQDGNNRSNGKLSVTGAISQAKQIDLPPLLKSIRKALGINDYKVILSYCINYITQTNEKGYEFWYAYLITRKIRYLSSRALSSASMFSEEKIKKQVGYTTDGALVDPLSLKNQGSNFIRTEGPSTLPGKLADELQTLVNKSLVEPTDNFVCSQDYEANSFERGLDIVAQVLDTKLSKDVICCLVRFLGHIDVDLLRKMRAILSIFLNSQARYFSGMIENLSAYLLNWVRETVVRLIMELVQAILDKIYRLVAEFLADLEGDFGALEDCPLIVELIQALLDALEIVMQDIEELVYNFIRTIEFNISLSAGLSEIDGGQRFAFMIIHKKRSIRRLIYLIDRVLYYLESGIELCDKEELVLKDNNKAVSYDIILDSSEIGDIDEYLNLSPQVKASYFATAKQVNFQDGTFLPDYEIGELQINSPGLSAPDCKRDISDEIMSKAIARYNSRGNA